MFVVLLAAGRSRRLQPIEDKNFLSFFGKPLIQHQIEALQKAGFEKFVIVGGAHNLAHLQALNKAMGLGAHVVEQKNLNEGMAGGVLSAAPIVGDEPVFIVSSNDLVDVSAFEMAAKAVRNGKDDGFMIAKKVSSYFPGGYLKRDADAMLQGIVEKPGEGNEPSDLVNLVIHFYRKPMKLFEALESAKSTRDDRYEVAVDTLLRSGFRMRALTYDGYWQALKYPWHVFDVWKFLFSGMKKKVSKSAVVAPSAVIRGDVVIEDGVKIFDHATVQGPCYIGKNSVVANNALVRESHIGADCVVGYSTEVARSYLGDMVWTHSNYIGDSVIGNNTSFGAGCVTGNLRLDEKNIVLTLQDEKVDSGLAKFGLVTGEGVRVGINTSFMPGVKIGGGSFIGAGIVVAQDVEPGKFVYGKSELVIKDNMAKADMKEREKFKKKI